MSNDKRLQRFLDRQEALEMQSGLGAQQDLELRLAETNRKLSVAVKALEFYACVQEEAHPQLQVNVDGIVSWESISGRAREALKEIAECDSPTK